MLHALYSISKPKRRLGVARPAVLVARVLGTGAYENDTRSTDPVIPADLASPGTPFCFFDAIRFPDLLDSFLFYWSWGRVEERQADQER